MSDDKATLSASRSQMDDEAQVDKWVGAVAVDGSKSAIAASALKTMLLRARVAGKIEGLETRSSTASITPICMECEEPRTCHDGDYCFKEHKCLSTRSATETPIEPWMAAHVRDHKFTDWCDGCQAIQRLLNPTDRTTSNG